MTYVPFGVVLRNTTIGRPVNLQIEGDWMINGRQESKLSTDAGVTASACSHGNKAISTLLNCLTGKTVIDDVVQGNPAPAMHGLVQFFLRAKRCDRNRNLPFRAGRQIFLQPVV